MKGEERREILDLPPDVRALVGECELTGKRTVFTRNERPVVILASYDEYTALRETLAISNDAALRAKLEAAEAQVARNALLLAEELTGERVANETRIDAMLRIDRWFHREQAQHAVGAAADFRRALRAPRPHRRAHVMHGADAALLEPAFDAKVEVGCVDADERIRCESARAPHDVAPDRQ